MGAVGLCWENSVSESPATNYLLEKLILITQLPTTYKHLILV